MNHKRLGRQTVALEHPPSVAAFANIGGKFEGQGPLKDYFDELCDDAFFGEKTWEKAESTMQKRVLKRALERAGVQPEDVDYINAHGTSTPLNDAGETAAVKTVFGDHAYKLAISSTKSMTGHMLGAAGAVEAIFCAMALHDGYLPATINYQVPDPACDLDVVPGHGRSADVRYAMSNSLGFGGHNGSLLFKRWEA